MRLYDYIRSSAAYRVRIALNLKGIDHERHTVNLVAGEQRGEAYAGLNPQKLVPALVLGNGRVLVQSLAICEYLEEQHPSPPLLPTDAEGRARVRALAQIVAADIHPLNNLRVLQYLVGGLAVDEHSKLEWYQHWIAEGFGGLETLLHAADTGRFCHGDAPTLADVCLVPQVFNARRFDCDLSPYPSIVRIAERCNELPEFAAAHPDRHPDA